MGQEEKNNPNENIFYFCPRCKRIPRIGMKNKGKHAFSVEISCNCYEFEENYENANECSKDDLLSEYAKYRIYTFDIDNFFNKVLSWIKKKVPICSYCSTEKESKYYCIRCNSHFCDECQNLHEKNIYSLCKNYTIREVGANFALFCEKEECLNKPLAEYIHKNKLTCENCKKKIQNVKEDLQEIPKDIENNIKNINKMFENIKNKDADLEKLKKFYKSLLAPYKILENNNIKRLDFNVVNNIVLFENFLEKYLASKPRICGIFCDCPCL